MAFNVILAPPVPPIDTSYYSMISSRTEGQETKKKNRTATLPNGLSLSRRVLTLTVLESSKHSHHHHPLFEIVGFFSLDSNKRSSSPNRVSSPRILPVSHKTRKSRHSHDFRAVGQSVTIPNVSLEVSEAYSGLFRTNFKVVPKSIHRKKPIAFHRLTC